MIKARKREMLFTTRGAGVTCFIPKDTSHVLIDMCQHFAFESSDAVVAEFTSEIFKERQCLSHGVFNAHWSMLAAETSRLNFKYRISEETVNRVISNLYAAAILDKHSISDDLFDNIMKASEAVDDDALHALCHAARALWSASRAAYVSQMGSAVTGALMYARAAAGDGQCELYRQIEHLVGMIQNGV